MKKQIILNGNKKTTLTVYINDNYANQETFPLVLVCPGGGFLDCSINEGECVALRFVELGYHGAVLNYSTAASSAMDCKYPKQLTELAQSICLIREHAKEWRVDKDKIAILGFSAGGHICASYSNMWKQKIFDEYGATEKRKVNAVILCYPLLDMIAQREKIEQQRKTTFEMQSIIEQDQRIMLMQELQNAMEMTLFGHTPISRTEAEETSPVRFISSETTPTFIWHTFADNIVSPIQSIHYAERLYQYGVPCELHLFQNGEHGISLADETSAKKEKGIDKHLAHWSQLVKEWLDIQFFGK